MLTTTRSQLTLSYYVLRTTEEKYERYKFQLFTNKANKITLLLSH